MSTRAELKITGLPEDFQYEDFNSFVEMLVKHLSVEIPREITNVVISAEQPSDNERDSLWIRRNNAGGFVGIYVYSSSNWVQMYPAPNQIIWMRGLSSQMPKGYRLIDDNHPNFSEYEVNFYKNRYLEKEGGGDYIYFAVTFDGI